MLAGGLASQCANKKKHIQLTHNNEYVMCLSVWVKTQSGRTSPDISRRLGFACNV